MTALEEIEAAIEKLEQLRYDATQGRWDWIAGVSTGDARLVATLHRTIDAQLVILRTARDASSIERNWETLVYTDDSLTLARAINGGTE